MFASATNYGSEMEPWIFNRADIWVEVPVSVSQRDYPVCAFGNYTTLKGEMIRAVGDSLMMGPIENGPKNEGFFMPDSWRRFSQCGINFIFVIKLVQHC